MSPIPTSNAAVQSQEANQALLQALQEMKLEFSQALDHINNTRNHNNNNGRNGGGRFRYRRNTNCYCWTHGACTHHGRDCRNQAEGHKSDATFNNRLDGSDRYCRTSNNKNITN